MYCMYMYMYVKSHSMNYANLTLLYNSKCIALFTRNYWSLMTSATNHTQPIY